MKIRLLPLYLILSLWIVTNSYGYEVRSKEEKSFKMNPGSYISVIGNDGYIKIDSWDKNEVHLVITKRAWAQSKREAKERLKRIDIEIEHTNNRLYIRELDSYNDHQFSFWDIFDPDQWGHHNNSTTVDYELKVPRKVDLRLENDEGDIKVTNLDGDLDIDIDEGELLLKNIKFNDINIDVDEGDIDCYDLKGPKGRLLIGADEGTIRLEKVQMRKLRINCDEGDIILRGIETNTCEIETDEGDIEAKIDFQFNGNYRMYSDEGDVIIFLPKRVNLNYKLETAEGRIISDFDIDITELDDGERARGIIGERGAKLEVYTDEGDISLEKK